MGLYFLKIKLLLFIFLHNSYVKNLIIRNYEIVPNHQQQPFKNSRKNPDISNSVFQKKNSKILCGGFQEKEAELSVNFVEQPKPAVRLIKLTGNLVNFVNSNKKAC